MDLLIGACLISGMFGGLLLFFFVRSEILPASITKNSDLEEFKGTMSRVGLVGNHDGQVNDISVAAKGKRAVSGGDDLVVRVWDLESGKGLQSFPGHKTKVLSVSAGPEGEYMVSGDQSGIIKVWDLENGDHSEIKAHSGGVRTLEFYCLGHAIVSGGSDRTVRISEIHTGRELHRYEGHDSAITAASLSNDGRFVLVGTEDGEVSVWKVRDESSPVRRFTGLPGAISLLTLDIDSLVLTATSTAGATAEWDLEKGTEISMSSFIEVDDNEHLSTLAGSVGGYRLLFATPDKVLRCLDKEQDRVDSTERALSSPVTAAAFTMDGLYGVCGMESGEVEIWKVPLPNAREIQATQSLAKTIEQRGREHREYIDHMERARDAIDDEEVEIAEKEFTIARDLAKPGTIEYDVADMGTDQSLEHKDKGDQYVSFMEQGRELLKEGEFSAARRKFESAKRVYPEREEAYRAIEKSEEAERTKKILTDADLSPELDFEFSANGKDLLTLGTKFAYLYDRDELEEVSREAREKSAKTPKVQVSETPEVPKVSAPGVPSPTIPLPRKPQVTVAADISAPDPPIGLDTSPFTWTVRMTTKEPIPSDNLKLRVRLIRGADNSTLAEEDYPLKKGDRVFGLNGKADAPSGGWTSSEYYFRKFLVATINEEDVEDFGTEELVYEHDGPSAFRLGLLRWEKWEVDLTPPMVHKSPKNCVVPEISGEAGDAFRIDASGVIEPATAAEQGRIFRRSFRTAEPCSPEGLGYDALTMNFFKFRAGNMQPFGALIYQHTANPSALWQAWAKGESCHLLPEGGGVRLAINSVTYERRTTRTPFEQISKNSSKYWHDNGAFHVTLWYGRYDFPDHLEAFARDHFLRRFKR